jgi:DNA-binding MarR family transcriptional regulator
MSFEGYKYLSCVEIAGKLEVAKSRVCVVLEGLEKKGFVRKTSDPNDGRVKLISLSPVGQHKVREIEDYIFLLHQQLLEQIPFSLRATVINSLEVLNASMKEMKAKMTV